MSYVLAVDLGTTFTAAAVVRDGGEPQIATLEHHGTSVPSVLWLGPDKAMLVGTAAARRAAADAPRVVREFKRRIGDTTPILVGGSPYSAEQLSAKLLRWVFDTISEQEGGPPIGMAVTHPANWGPYKLELLNQLLRIAEVGPTVTITEPEAAAIQYAASERFEVGAVVTVYDLGGGTFDVAILRKTRDGFEMLGEPEGVERLGGIDFDAAVYGYVIDQLGSALDDVPPDNADWMAALAKLREECTSAKETMSVAPDATIEVWLPTGRHQVTITTELFNELIEPPVTETLKAVRRALQAAHVAPNDVGRILLVGGSSRIPIIRSTIEADLAIRCAVDTHPKHAVALGAARFAASAAFRSELPVSRIAEMSAPVDHAAEAAKFDDRAGRHDAMRSLAEQVATMADAHSRADLGERMRQRLARLESQTVRVLVAGDFKQGKSTLVNALVDQEICPADPDFATSVPTAIRHGELASATIYRDMDTDEPVAESIEVANVGRYVSETEGADPDRDRVRSCEISLPVDWLRAGIELVDMPGYGGLDATAGARIVAELRQAQAVLFVSDASQELTAPELDFLQTAVRHCPNVTCVMSKIDAYVDWRLIRDIDTGHLKHAALDVPIVPVSALLHLTAARRSRIEYDSESGIDELVRMLSQRIVADVEASQTLETVVDVESSLTQLRGVLLAEVGALDPARHLDVVDELRATLAGVEQLRLDNAAWHRFLRDSTEDLRVSSLDDFEARQRQLISEAESVIAANDPTVIWDEFQVWLRARATRLVGDLYGEIAEEVTVIERRLLEQLASAEDDALKFGKSLNSPFVGALSLDVMEDKQLEERATNVAIESSWSAAEPLLGLGGFIPGLGPVSLVVAAVAGLVFGRRALRQRKARALDARREEARGHLRDYTSEVERLVRRSVERYSYQLYRGMRDNVLGRADELERSVNDALRKANSANGKSAGERESRLATLRVQLADADRLNAELEALRAEINASGGAKVAVSRG
ncbi:MAG: heat shock protein 70 [Ilumatobacteraceae bacterium]|nr:heat shock protein 70 [Ilumatobacteraceae bacterium]